MFKQGRRLFSVVAAVALASSLCPTSTALADSLSVDGYVTAAAAKASQPGPEILGMTSVEILGSTDVNMDDYFDWSKPKLLLMGTTEYNVLPNPYFYNLMYDGSPAAVWNPSRNGEGGGPNQALAPYGEDETDDAVWNLLPDVVTGIGGTGNGGGAIDYDTDPRYAPAISEALDVDYHPKSVSNSYTDYDSLITSMYELAIAADEVVEESNGAKQLRYGSAMDIAQEYEAFVRGTQGYILSRLNDEGKDKKIVASINAIGEDNATFQLNVSGIKEGTASTNRYLEASEVVADNLVDVVGSQTVTLDQLRQADVILLGGLNNGATAEEVFAVLPAELQTKCYWVTSSAGSSGSMFGVVMNSPENVQNIGRILGCIYPEYVDQDNLMCFYYDHFYHIKAESLGSAIDNAMDGVRNWDAVGSDLTSWTEADAADYNSDATWNQMLIGMRYIEENYGVDENVLDCLVPSEYWESTDPEPVTPDVSFDDVADGDWWAAAVTWAASEGIVNGYGDGNFGPEDTITRAQAATFLWRYYNASASASYDQASAVNETAFSDVEDAAYYTEAANWAVENGVINGIDGSFQPDGLIDRAQLCTMVARAAEAFDGAVVEGASTDKLAAMPDAADVADWAAEYVAWCLNEGVINGVAQGDVNYVMPSEVVNRATMAQVLYNADSEGTIERA